MKLSKKPYKGTRDFFPEEKRIQDYIFTRMRETAALYGYEPYDGPLLEEVELYKAKSGEELINDQIYSFTDRGKRFVAIRPEMTPTLARMVSRVHREIPKPIRWYSIPNLMRYEQPQKGRLREHWQLNCDIFGAAQVDGSSEILQLLINLLEKFGANHEHFEILINDRIIVDTIFNQMMKLDTETTYKLYKIVDKAKKVSADKLEEMVAKLEIDSNAQEIFFNYLKLDSFEELFTFMDQHKQGNAKKELSEIYSIMQTLDLVKYIKYDPTIVRGLDYYTGIVFEIFDKNPENRRAICGGGAYANILKIFNEDPLPAVGFGLGDVTLTDFLTTHKLLPDLSTPSTDLFLTYQSQEAKDTAGKLAADLRRANIQVTTNLEAIKIKKVFPLATKKGAKFVGLLGEQELQAQEIQIKNMTNREQINLKFSEIESIIDFLKK